MRSVPFSQNRPARRRQPSRKCRRVVLLFVTASAIALSFSPAFANSQAQTTPAPTTTPSPTHHAHPHKKPAAAAPTPQPAPPPAPVVPPPPNWPANNLPGAASVVFDSRGLLVVASNSSLSQILKEVSVETGAKVEGFDADQRVFGTYGPAPVRDVLAQLFDGSGYDVLMIGDRGEGTPRRIVLSERSGAAAAPRSMANNAAPAPNNDDTDSDDQPEQQAEPEPPQAVPGPNGPPVPIRTPQQMMQEIQERQRQQQSQQNQQNPQN